MQGAAVAGVGRDEAPSVATREPAGARLLVWGMAGIFVVVLVWTAWVCDDAYITLRTVDNFVHGYGLRWNPTERVQAFTHPLWMFMLSAVYAVSGEPYVTLLVLSFACSLATILIVVTRIVPDATAAAGGVLALTLSKTFVDYSTSGLENPLTHLLLAAFFIVWWRGGDNDRRALHQMAALAGLCALNRMDVILLVGPALFVAARRTRRPLGPLLLGFAPFALWEVFATVYYGSPWPNTAYAKLGGAIPFADRMEQGWYYLIDSIAMDPLTLSVIATALAATVIQPRRGDLSLAAGLILMIAYVVGTGGDFMSGRLLAAPFFCAVLRLMRADWPSRGLVRALPACVLIVAGLAATDPALLTGPRFTHDNTDRDGIVDERKVYYSHTGLLNVRDADGPLSHPWAKAAEGAVANGDRSVVWGANGFYGFVAGRHLDIVDKFALGDALLARLPALPDWRPGHLERRIPEGYLETRTSGRNRIEEPGVAALYNHIKRATQDPLFSRARFYTLWKLNTGGYDSLLQGTTYGVHRVQASDVAAPVAEGAREETVHAVRIRERGLEVAFGAVVRGASVELSLDGNDDYVVVFRLRGQDRGRRFVARAWRGGESVFRVAIVQPPIGVPEFDSILVRAHSVWGTGALGHARLRP